MTTTVLHRLFTQYYEGLEKHLRLHDPLRLLIVLDTCRKDPATQEEIIERSGFSQSWISKLLPKLSEAGIVKAVAPGKRFGQRYELTENGRKQLSKLEEALKDTISAVQASQSSEDQLAQQLDSKEPGAQDPTSEDGPQTDTTEIWDAFSKLFPDRLERYEKSRPKVNGRH